MKTSPALASFSLTPSLRGFFIIPILTLFLSVNNAGAQTLDSDTDGLLDAWEIQHFGSLSDPNGGPADDPDGDSCSNLDECNAATDPNDATDCFVAIVPDFTPTGQFKFEWPSVLGKKYHLQLSSDLSTWTTLSNAAGTTPIDFLGTGQTISADFTNPAAPVVTCGVTRELWFDAAITANLGVFKTYIGANPPDGVEWRPTLKAPTNYGDSYGARYTGFIVSDTGGTYNFYIANRHQAEFRISTDDNPANLPVAATCSLLDNQLTVEEDWDYLTALGVADTQKSADVTLVAGQRYYIEILHTNEGQLDHLAVGWELGDSGTIEVVPCTALRPNVDFTDNNAPAVPDPVQKFARAITYGALGALGGTGGLDSDGDGVEDSVENILYGFNPFTPDGVNGGAAGNDFDVLAAASVADPAADVVTVLRQDGLAEEDTGLLGTGVPRMKNVARFRIRRAGSLVPKTVEFVINGAIDPVGMGDPTAADFNVETVTGAALAVTGGTYAISLPFGADDVFFEINPVLDEVVEDPEQLQAEVKDTPDYVLGAASTAVATIHDARDDPENLKYYIATFSKEPVAAMPTTASGATSLVLDGSNRVAIVNDFFENLSSTQTNTHIHKAKLAPDGITITSSPPDIVESITDDGTETGTFITGPVSNYTYLIEPRGAFTVQDVIDSLEFDNPKQGSPVGTTPLYNNKHTMDNGQGEIWGIYRRQPASTQPPLGGTEDRIPPTPPITPIDPVTEPDKLRREVARFLTQATFGPTEADIAELTHQIENVHGGDRIAAYDAWMTAQWALDQTLVRDLVHALDMQEFTLRGYFDPTRNGAATVPPVAPAATDWPDFRSQNISAFDSLDRASWLSGRPDDDFPLTAQQENQLDGILGSPNHNNRRRAQWTVMAHGHDQLRQRVGFALSEIMIISEEATNIRQHHIAAARWHDMLAENADDHFRELLEDVTYSPLMGKYLSHLQNSRESTQGGPGTGGTGVPDENYAREIMQLFTIGLLELWDDGFIKLDPTEFNLLPTYTNDDIKELARVMTGMSWVTNSASNTNWDTPNIDVDRDNPTASWYDDGPGNLWYSSRYNYPMAFYDGEHDNGSKLIAGNKTISNGGAAQGRYRNEGDRDLEDVHNYFGGSRNNLFGVADSNYNASWSTNALTNHQNPPAFISRRLIQRLVTSNPSGPYIYRVAQVWRQTNGQLDEVIRAILLDPEARNLDTTELNREFGKKKEPIVAWIQALRAVSSRSRVTFDGTVIPGDPVLMPNQTHNGTLSPITDPNIGNLNVGDLASFEYPASQANNFVGVVAYDAAGQMTGGPVAFTRLPATTIRVNAMDGGGNQALGQTPLKAPTVFNWFLPDYQPGGLIASFGLFAPEFQIATESSVFQNINTYWVSHWGTAGFSGTAMGGSNSNSDLAGYGTILGGGTNHTDDNEIPDYFAFINRYKNYPTIPTNTLTDEGDWDLQLIDDLDDLLFAGRYKLLYPIDASDDGAHVTEGAFNGANAASSNFPNRNPRENLLYYLTFSYNTTSDANIWNKVRAALYMMTTSPEFLVQK